MEAGGAGDEHGGVGGGQSLVAPSALWGIRGCVLNADALGCSEAVRPSVSFLLGPTLTYPPPPRAPPFLSSPLPQLLKLDLQSRLQLCLQPHRLFTSPSRSFSNPSLLIQPWAPALG